MKTGKAFGIIGAVLGYLLFLFSLTFTFLGYPKAYNALFITTAILNFFLAVCSGILFVGLANEVCTDNYDDDYLTQLGVEFEFECKPGATGYCAVVAFLFFIGAGTSILVMRNNCLKPRRAQQSNGPPTLMIQVGDQDMPSTLPLGDKEMTTIVIHDNGDGTQTKTTTKTMMMADGTQQMEKIIETIYDS